MCVVYALLLSPDLSSFQSSCLQRPSLHLVGIVLSLADSVYFNKAFTDLLMKSDLLPLPTEQRLHKRHGSGDSPVEVCTSLLGEETNSSGIEASMTGKYGSTEAQGGRTWYK